MTLVLAIVGAAYGLRADRYGHDTWPRGEGLAVKIFWLISDPFANFRLRGEDLPVLAGSRTGAALGAFLFEPLDGHAAPLFRLWTHALAAGAGTLAHLPAVLAWASFGVLLAVMFVGGHVVATETGDRAVGLAALVGLGVTTVMDPAATWYSAGQSLWAGLCMLLMLIALRGWRMGGSRAWLVAAALTALAAPAFGVGGYAAGPAGACYLLAGERPGRRWAALVPLLGIGLVAGTLALLAGDLPTGATTAPWLALLHTAQAIPEGLLLNNLGIDGSVTPIQGTVLVAALAALWGWSRGSFRPSPIEAAGASLVAFGYLLTRPADNGPDLLALRWDHTIPQIGAVLVLAGWWASLQKAGAAVHSTRPPTRRAIPALLGLTVLLLGLHAPRAQRLFLETVPPLAESERERFPIPSLQRLRGLYLTSQQASWQRRALARFDRAEHLAATLGIGHAAIRQSLGPISLPGWPDHVTEPDPINLLDLPPGGPAAGPARVRSALGPLLAPEPEPRPEWLEPDAVWPPSREG